MGKKVNSSTNMAVASGLDAAQSIFASVSAAREGKLQTRLLGEKIIDAQNQKLATAKMAKLKRQFDLQQLSAMATRRQRKTYSQMSDLEKQYSKSMSDTMLLVQSKGMEGKLSDRINESGDAKMSDARATAEMDEQQIRQDIVAKLRMAMMRNDDFYTPLDYTDEKAMEISMAMKEKQFNAILNSTSNFVSRSLTEMDRDSDASLNKDSTRESSYGRILNNLFSKKKKS